MRQPELKQYFKRAPGDPRPIEVTVEHRLQFSESDPLKIAWHGNFAKFFEAAYSELARTCGFDAGHLEGEHVSALFYHDEYDYRIPIPCGELLRTSASLVWSEAPRINIEYAVRLTDGRVAATGWHHADLHRRPRFHPALAYPRFLGRLPEALEGR